LRQLRDTDAEISTCIAQDKATAHKRQILTSIPGVGAVTAAAILIACPEIGTLTGKQVASLSGLAPMTRQSGKWRGKAFIRGGRKHLRDALNMPDPRRRTLQPGTEMQISGHGRRRKTPESRPDHTHAKAHRARIHFDQK